MIRTGCKHGMTLVEMMVAMAIVGLLSAGALAVATSISRGRHRDEKKTASATVAEGIESILAIDIRNATKYRSLANGIELYTQTSLDADTFAVRHLPVTVSYEIREIAGAKWLVRKQHEAGRNGLTELICRDATKITLTPIDSGTKPSSGTMSELPPSVEAVVEFKDPQYQPVRVRYRIR